MHQNEYQNSQSCPSLQEEAYATAPVAFASIVFQSFLLNKEESGCALKQHGQKNEHERNFRKSWQCVQSVYRLLKQDRLQSG
jgi:hypothetical protein